MPSIPYQLLPTTADGDKVQDSTRKIRREKIKRVLFYVLTIFTVMFFALQGLKVFVRSSSQFLHHGPGCHGGMHRNLSSLPSHYTLPSGNKIPSVALGTEYVSLYQ